MLAFKHNAGSFGTPRTLVSDAETSGGPISLHNAIGVRSSLFENFLQDGLHTLPDPGFHIPFHGVLEFLLRGQVSPPHLNPQTFRCYRRRIARSTPVPSR